uniref:Ionotropic receptor 76a, isoform D n=1 Tax=Drosophila melanogaster TaxID=7227 RepID=B7Z084_DROME|nr:ionotropic receptor 76a, isoform D [Drosophila melanogaster]ACL83337.1 ionotropic receptor 76a, isoform D [Drosophila melanogaster]|eukprot:NP_001137982.1 ionotropic receptor 76a, isoform D [Drosophila melanogaster]
MFVYTKEFEDKKDSYLSGYIFQDQPNILVITSQYLNSSTFEIKTNRFVGPRNFNKNPEPVEFYILQRFDAKGTKATWETQSAMSSKMRNLKGREVVIGIFDYKPFMLLDYLCELGKATIIL